MIKLRGNAHNELKDAAEKRGVTYRISTGGINSAISRSSVFRIVSDYMASRFDEAYLVATAFAPR